MNKLAPFYLKSDKKLCNLSINENDISTIIRNLDPNKSHGWDNLLVRMIKLCGDSLIYPFKCIFEGALQEDKYPDSWKKANVVPVHKKESKSQIIAIIFSQKINLVSCLVILAFFNYCLLLTK